MNSETYRSLFAVGLFLVMLLLLGDRTSYWHPSPCPRPGRSTVEARRCGSCGIQPPGITDRVHLFRRRTRFDGRRQLAVEEVNDIGTAQLRLDLLPAGSAANLRQLFRQYLDSRIETYCEIFDRRAAETELARSVKLQGEIWSATVTASRDSGSQPSQMLLLPALNQMIDITTTRAEATRLHPPPIIFVMVSVLSLAASLLAGYGMAGGKARSWLHMIGFAAVVAITVYVIMDIEYPRLGLIRVDDADRVLLQLRESMQPAAK